MKRLLTSAILVMALVFGGVSLVGAYTIDNLGFLFDSGDTITAPGALKTEVTEVMSSPFTSGSYEATYLGFEAGHQDYLVDDAKIFGNQSESSAGDKANVNVASTFFYDYTDNDPAAKVIYLTGMTNLKMFSLLGSDLNSFTDDKGWFEATSNYYVVGFGDGAGDGDFDDLVVAVKANPVPIPGAVWLLGSGLLGLVGIRRKKA